jgi:hypothetical protein
MGYTHYWRRPPRLNPQAFGRALTDCRRILPELQIPLAGSDGRGKPIYRANEIVFNGLGDASYETFAIRLEEPDSGEDQLVFAFCKTARKPYDLAVQVALIVFRHHLGNYFIVSSDGGDPDWEAARQICQKHLGYGDDFRLDPD